MPTTKQKGRNAMKTQSNAAVAVKTKVRAGYQTGGSGHGLLPAVQ